MTALEVRDLHVSLGGAPILHGIDLSVEPGETVALLGPSGSGKTTLLYAVAGFVDVTGGEISVAGDRVSRPERIEPPESRSVGFVFQNYALWPHLSAVETVAYPLLRQGESRAAAVARAEALLELAGIGGLGGRRPSELSGGQQQRVGLARALARDASLYLLDEPTAHLDSALRADLQEELAGRMTGGGAAAVYSTHDAAEAMAVSDRIVLLRDGRVVQTGNPAEIYSQPADLWAARLTGPAWEIDGGAAGLEAGRVVVRPDWVRPGAGVSGTVSGAWFRGPHTDYRLQTEAGTVEMRIAGAPEWGGGDRIEVEIARWWGIG